MRNYFEAFIGQDMYDFDKAMCHYFHDMNLTEHALKTRLAALDRVVKTKQALYYHATLTTFNPQTGETTTQTWHAANKVKEKTIINPQAKKEKKKIAIEKALFDGIVPPPQPEPAVFNGNVQVNAW